MTREVVDRSRRRHSSERHDKRESSLHSHKVTQKNYKRGEAETQHHGRNKNRDYIDRHSRDCYEQASTSREGRHRISVDEIGKRRRQNESSSEEREPQMQSLAKHHSGKKRGPEESFEELSRRKRRIESELNALDAAEATSSRDDSRHRSQNKSHSAHSRNKQGRSSHQPDRHIKQEVLSGDERPQRHHHLNVSPVNIKQELFSDDERSRRHRHHQPSNSSRRPRPDGGQRVSEGRWGHAEEPQAKPKEKPNFAISGKLAEDTNTYNGVVIKYNEPPEARKPKRKWRLYPFKGDSHLPFVPIHRQSAYLLGRTRLVADIPIDHPSCSKQHAVLQFRILPYKRDDGTTGRSVKPYIIDLESSNGTFVNNKKIEPRRYVELLEQDVLKFGFSSREYVILHEDSKKVDDDDDVKSS